MDYRRILRELYKHREKLERAIEELEGVASGSRPDAGPKHVGVNRWDRKSVAKYRSE